MKTVKLLALASFVLLFSQCKTTAPTATSSSSATLNEVAQTIDTVETQVLLYADSTNGNDHAALGLAAKWLQRQTNIQSVSVLDSNYLYFTLQSGLMGMFYLDELDNYGMSLTRGGRGGGSSLHRFGILSTNKITNPSVLLFMPVFDEFYTAAEFQGVLNKLSNSGLGLTVTVKKDSECTTDVVDHFGDYGFVIIDTHGMPNGFLTGHEIIDSLPPGTYNQALREINTGNIGYDKFKAGQVMLTRGLAINPGKPGWQKTVTHISHYPLRVLLSTNYIVGLPKLPGTVVFGNMCYSGQNQAVPAGEGASTPIQTAFASLNPISYYGYSYASGFASPVTNEFAKEMEDSLLTQFVTNTDSTGHCYLQRNGTEYYDTSGLRRELSKEKLFLKHFGANDYSYQKCGDTLLDARDGQKYATVCIGSQVWMAENLRYNAPGSKCYDDQSSNCDIYGKLYNWTTAMNGAAASNTNPSNVTGICPKGWHLPSSAEWTQLVSALGGDQIAGGALKSTALWQQPHTGANNSSGFNGLPGGFCLATGGTVQYSAIGIFGYFLSSSLITVSNQSPVPGLLQLSAYGPTTTYTSTLTSHDMDGLEPCRCVKDP